VSDQPTLPPPPPPVPPGGGVWADAPTPQQAPVDPAQLRGLRSLSTAVMALVAVVAMINLASVPNELAYLSNLQGVLDGQIPDLGKIQDQEDLRATFGLLSIISLVVAGVVWVMWQQRARACAEQMGARGQRHGRGLAIFGWAIPIANLFVPKQVTDDLWRASDPDAKDVAHIEGRPVWGVINGWWGLWIIGGVIGRFIFRADNPDTLDELESFTSSVRLGLVATVLTLASAALGILIVHRITARLLERAVRRGVAV
jgi:hypothetical protein